MDAVFCEEEMGWDDEKGLATCSITIYNYTARARAYTILAKWPEGDGTAISDNPLGGGQAGQGTMGMEAGYTESRNCHDLSLIHISEPTRRS